MANIKRAQITSVAKQGRSAATPIIRHVETGIAISSAIGRAYTNGKEFWNRKFAYTVTLSERDSLYSEAYDWLIATLPNEKHRTVAVSSPARSRSGSVGYGEVEDAVANAAKPLTVRFSDEATRTVTIEGHQVSVSLSKPDVPESSNGRGFREPEYSSIHFVAKSHAGQQAIIRQLETLNRKRATSRKAVLKMVNQWGSWSTRSDLPPRTMDSVALPVEQKERIIEDLGTFLGSEDQYNRLAIPWHRGYMLYGPPGTGKTSLVKALANEFNLDLWYVSLSDLTAESSLLGLLADVGPRSLLLLEDIDTMRITHDRDGAEQGKINMSSLLNTLDGVATPHGLITVMTTNRFDILDPALTRAGRMDLVENLTYPSLDTLGNMYQHFFGKAPEWSALESITGTGELEGLSTGEIAELLKRNMSNPEAASDAVIKRVTELYASVKPAT